MTQDSLSQLASRLKPFIMKWINDSAGSTGIGIASETGDHGQLLGLIDDDHDQYLLASTAAGDGLSISNRVLAVNVSGLGLSISSDNVTLTSSSNPGAAAAILASNSSGYLQLVRLGLGVVSPAYYLHIQGTATPQVRVAYDSSNYANFQVSSTGNLTVAPTGNLVFNPGGNLVAPASNYDISLGTANYKYLALYAAELVVDTLVAQDVMATIGGRVMVTPTSSLTSNLASGETTIYLKHNSFTTDDILFMEKSGQFESLKITAGPSGSGPYSYTVTRDFEASGTSHDWIAGDAVVNTDMFIDLFSTSGIISGTGPTITGTVRNSATTWNDLSVTWAIGNLNGLFGISSDTVGVAFGDYSGGNYLVADVDGLSLYAGDNTIVIDSLGISMTSGTGSGNTLKWVDGAEQVGYLYTYEPSASYYVTVLGTRTATSGLYDARLEIRATTSEQWAMLYTPSLSSNFTGFIISDDALDQGDTPNALLDVRGAVRLEGSLQVNDSDTQVLEGDSNRVRLQNDEVYTDIADDVYINENEGLAKRQTAYIALNEHFNDTSMPTGWSWATAPFSTPSSISFSTLSQLTLGNSSADTRHFLYYSSFVSSIAYHIGCALSGISTGNYIGWRLDDGTDDNYVEAILVNNTSGQYTCYGVYNTGGGGRTSYGTAIAFVSTNQPIIKLQINGTRWSSWTVSVILKMANSPAGTWPSGPTTSGTQTWTPTRMGIIYGHGTNSWEIGYVDWVDW